MTKTEQVYTYILSHSPYTLDYKELSKNLSISNNNLRVIVHRLLKDKYILQSGDKKTGQILTINSDKTMDIKIDPKDEEIKMLKSYINLLEYIFDTNNDIKFDGQSVTKETLLQVKRNFGIK